MISLLVTVLVLCLVFGLVYWAITLFPIPAPFKNIALAVLALILVLVLLNALGLVGTPWVVRLR